MKSILDPTFRYVPSASTDIRRTFARIRREQKEAAAREQAVREEAARVVRKLPAKVKVVNDGLDDGRQDAFRND